MRYGWFDVTGKSGRRYRIVAKCNINVILLDIPLYRKFNLPRFMRAAKDRKGLKLCLVPGECIPMPDMLLAQKMYLETNDIKFILESRTYD